VVSLGSTTGFASADFDLWSDPARALLMVAAVLGGCAASTAGGAKMVRWLVTGNFLRREMVHALHPSAVVPVRYKKAVVSTQILRAVVAVVLLYGLGYLLVGTLLVLMGCDLVTGYSAAVACLNNVGPGLGRVGPMASYAWMPDGMKVVLTATMWLGRLEIVAVLALLRPDAWRGTRWAVQPTARGPSPVHA
jgi:trk system potassium uptake protein TrkH